jgi:hypothetical protein
MDGAIPAAGDDGVEAVTNGSAHLRSCVGGSAGRSDINFNAGFAQNGSGGPDILQAVLFSPARVWIVEESGFAHGWRILCELALP